MQVVEYPPLQCKECGAAVNPYAHVDYSSKMWVCPHCTVRNWFPGTYSNISPEHMPAELFPECTTIEYVLPQQTTYPPIYIFIVDTAVSEEELEACKNTLKQALTMMPENCLIGLISFGTHVHVHELQATAMSKVYVFRGTGEYNPATIATQLGLRAAARAQQQAHSRFDGILATKFLVSLEEGEYEISSALEQLQPDAYPPPSDHRKSRCTGTAVQVAAGLAATGLPENVCAVRLMLFVGGPCTEGAPHASRSCDPVVAPPRAAVPMLLSAARCKCTLEPNGVGPAGLHKHMCVRHQQYSIRLRT